MNKTTKLLAVPVLAAVMGISTSAHAQWGTSPGRSDIVEGRAITNTASSTTTTTQQSSGNVGQYVDDAAITAKVKAALMSDSQMKATNVSVETVKGTVQLSGTVANADQRSQAEKIANRVDGVKSVQDLLKVRTTQEE